MDIEVLGDPDDPEFSEEYERLHEHATRAALDAVGLPEPPGPAPGAATA